MIIHGTTRVFAIFGDPVAHSLSPRMHNAAFDALKIDGVYVPFRVAAEELEAAVNGIRAMQIAGLSITVPHKEAILPLLDDIDPGARQIGAVNTVVNCQGRLIGYNTDAPGFITALQKTLNFSPRGRKIVLIGAGGAARAALVALAEKGAASIVIANRSLSRAEELVATYRIDYPDCTLTAIELYDGHFFKFLHNTDLLVNTSTIGLHGETFPPEIFTSLAKNTLIFDMVYVRGVGSTPLIEEGVRIGHCCADGRSMLIAQGEEAFALWTGTCPPEGMMAEALQL